MDANSAIAGLEQYLSGTGEFMELKKSRQEIRKNPNFESLFTQFQKKQEAMYSQKLSPNQQQFLMDELDRDYQKLLAIPEIDRYYRAADRFTSLVNNIMQQLNNRLDEKLLLPT